MISCQDAETLVQNASKQAVSDAEDLMEAVMREAMRMLREELLNEIKEVAKPMNKLESAQGMLEREVNSQKAQLDACSPKTGEKRCADHELKLAACLKALEELKKEVTYHKEQLTASLSAAPKTDENRLVDHEEKLAACLQAHEELKKQVTDHKEQLTACLSLDQKQSLQVATPNQVETQISSLHALISQIQEESTKHASKEQVDKQIADLQVQLSERIARPDFVTRCDLEAIRESTLSEVREHGKQIKEHVEKQISELQRSSQSPEAQFQSSHSDLEEMMKRQLQQMQKKVSQQNGRTDLDREDQDFTAPDLRGHGEATRESVDKQISDLQTHVSEIKEHLAQRTDKLDVVTRADQDAMRDHLLGQMSKLRGHMNDLNKISDVFFPQVQKELSALSSQVADIQKQSGPSTVELELKQMQKNMNAHLHELREVVDSLVKGNAKEKETYKWAAKVATLEHNVDELRSEAEALRLTVNSEKRRAAQAKKRCCEEEGVFCKLFL